MAWGTMACQPLADALYGELTLPALKATPAPSGDEPSSFTPDGFSASATDVVLNDLLTKARRGAPRGHIQWAADHHPDDMTSSPSRRAEYVLLGVDCFGAEDAACQRYVTMAGLQEGRKLPLGWTGDGVAAQIQRVGQYALVALSPSFYPDGSVYVTIDLVTPHQRQARRTRPAPTEYITTRSNLLDVYAEFSGIWFELFSKGVRVDTQPRRGAWEYHHAQLRPYTRLFRAEVPRHRQELIQVMLNDAHAPRRAAAASLLGFDHDDNAVGEALAFALLDAESNVRAAASRALVPKLRRAVQRGDALIATQHVFTMLAQPSTADRAGAAALLVELARLPKLRTDIQRHAGPTLRRMASAHSPSARDLAREALALLQ